MKMTDCLHWQEVGLFPHVNQQCERLYCRCSRRTKSTNVGQVEPLQLMDCTIRLLTHPEMTVTPSCVETLHSCVTLLLLPESTSAQNSYSIQTPALHFCEWSRQHWDNTIYYTTAAEETQQPAVFLTTQHRGTSTHESDTDICRSHLKSDVQNYKRCLNTCMLIVGILIFNVSMILHFLSIYFKFWNQYVHILVFLNFIVIHVFRLLLLLTFF